MKIRPYDPDLELDAEIQVPGLGTFQNGQVYDVPHDLAKEWAVRSGRALIHLPFVVPADIEVDELGHPTEEAPNA